MPTAALLSRHRLTGILLVPYGARQVRRSAVGYPDRPVGSAARHVRHVLAQRPDLLLADSHRHGRVGRWLLADAAHHGVDDPTLGMRGRR
jgi:hypothetical protein